jgi:hypothetical protein
MKKKTTTIFKVRVTGAVLDTATATRQVKIGDDVLTFGRDPIYLRAEKLPHKLTSDPHLRIDTVEAAPPDVVIIDLKAERVQFESALAPGAEPGDETDLKAERVQED